MSPTAEQYPFELPGALPEALARGGDDVWAEIRRRPVHDDDLVVLGGQPAVVLDQVEMDMVAVVLERDSSTLGRIRAAGCFSVNLLTAEPDSLRIMSGPSVMRTSATSDSAIGMPLTVGMGSRRNRSSESRRSAG